jgi:CPA1 family monovalent cation:H+ antiporter
VPAPDPLEDALARATVLQQASKSGFKRLKELEYDDQHGVFALLKQRIEQRNFAAWERLGTALGEESPSDLYGRVRSTMIGAERNRVLEIRRSGTVPSDVVAEVLAMLDVEESMLEVAQAERSEIHEAHRERRVPGQPCPELGQYPVLPAITEEAAALLVCNGCVEEGTRWVALRRCLACGHVGCCDSSPRQHATRHFRDTAHPVIQSSEPHEDWRWCYVHHQTA